MAPCVRCPDSRRPFVSLNGGPAVAVGPVPGGELLDGVHQGLADATPAGALLDGGVHIDLPFKVVEKR